jgi:hypothetical protein
VRAPARSTAVRITNLRWGTRAEAHFDECLYPALKGRSSTKSSGADPSPARSRAWIIQAALLRFGSGWHVVGEAVWGEVPDRGHSRDSSTRSSVPIRSAQRSSGLARKDRFRRCSFRGPKWPLFHQMRGRRRQANPQHPALRRVFLFCRADGTTESHTLLREFALENQ